MTVGDEKLGVRGFRVLSRPTIRNALAVLATLSLVIVAGVGGPAPVASAAAASSVDTAASPP
ncbi:hypothetical protein [Rarobacter incanus]|uniref:hypothetical protein n=1 Tax=Rarobacter incanus TaxID=153494 RepID=UPI001476EA22|nr:hypothetical protein [Rarobacter incanus]